MQEPLTIRKNLKTIGNSTFIRYFYKFQKERDENVVCDFDTLFAKENWKVSAKKMKVDAGRRIFKNKTEKEALEIVLSARNDEETTSRAVQIYTTLYPDETPRTIRFIRPQFMFDDQIVSNLFKGYTIEREFAIGSYRIDWYIPELRLAIELDEKHHVRQASDDKRRQQFIEAELGCKFLRYTL